jgi:rhamnose utilization protein RhaD (predicted bifunctional aldolase and dehydrogenase)
MMKLVTEDSFEKIIKMQGLEAIITRNETVSVTIRHSQEEKSAKMCQDKLMTPDISLNASLMSIVAATTRQRVIMEIQAFANDYQHNIEGFEVVRVDQLLDFLKEIPESEYESQRQKN